MSDPVRTENLRQELIEAMALCDAMVDECDAAIAGLETHNGAMDAQTPPTPPVNGGGSEGDSQ